MTKTILFLTDGMADLPLPELGGKTPLEYAHTPHMDAIAHRGASGTFLSLPAGFPTSSDVANLSVLGYDLATCYPGRGPLEALSQGLHLGPQDIAFRCNLIHADGDTLVDYSGGHLDQARANQLIAALKQAFDSDQVTFHPGVSYRNLLILHGSQFSPQVHYEKPDASQGLHIPDLLLRPADDSAAARHTAAFLNDLTLRSRAILADHPANHGHDHPANLIWPWSPGRKPIMPAFSEKYAGARGAVISAVDVIFGLGACAGMDIIRVPGATGFIDTNYEGKADAAVQALQDHDFVYLHVEAADECSHMGDLQLKLRAITDIDHRLVGRVMAQLQDQEVTYAVLPDHPVPIHQRIHTRTPVPVSICGPHIVPDAIAAYSETLAPTGTLGHFTGDQLMRRILNLP
jgi:2,3-bisphosphoglycerate-independent phosphoglycerate mutase